MKKKILIGGVICIGAISGILIYTASRYQNTSTERLPDKYNGNIEQIHSTIDEDQDGIDDQMDVLEGALDYIASKPTYKSRYYQVGYSDDYNIDEPDINIDFRRVKNLKVYFSHTAISLTTDISNVEEWQGGDIVIFQNHVGIVSERRNKNGVPYVIHHNDPWQTAYEQDILETRDDIAGHYRITE